MDKMTQTKNALFEHGERTNQAGNCLVIHGGGLCPSSKDYLSTLADALTAMPEVGEVFVGLYSFECFFEPEKWILPWSEFREEIKDAPGGAFGTSRGVVVEAPETVEKIIAACKVRNITHWFIAGGDGSSRAACAVASMLEEAGIQVICPQILTIDGVNGGMPLGVYPCVEKSWETLCDVSATNLQTDNCHHSCPSIVVLMGRERNEPLAYLLKRIVREGEIARIPISEIDIFALPAGSKDPEGMVNDLIKRISENCEMNRKTIVLMSEGFPIELEPALKECKLKFSSTEEVTLKAGKILRKIEEIKYSAFGNEYNLKARIHVIGYTQQMSKYSDDPRIIAQIVTESIPVIREGMLRNVPFAVVREAMDTQPRLEKIEYYAARNPKLGQEPILPEELQELLDKYAP